MLEQHMNFTHNNMWPSTGKRTLMSSRFWMEFRLRDLCICLNDLSSRASRSGICSDKINYCKFNAHTWLCSYTTPVLWITGTFEFFWRSNTLFSMWNTYEARLPPAYYQEKLLSTGDFLFSVKVLYACTCTRSSIWSLLYVRCIIMLMLKRPCT